MNDDPMKNLNNEFYLNDVALKSRFSLMRLNKKNRRRKVDNGAHWLKFVPYPIMDKDLKNNLFHQGKNSIDRLNKTNTEVLNKLKESKLKKILNSINQTNAISNELIDKRRRRKFFHKMETLNIFNSNPYTKSGNNTLKIYEKDNLNKTYLHSIPFVTNKKEINQNKKRIIYDIGPINTKSERGSCVFPNINNNIENSYENNSFGNSKNNENNKQFIDQITYNTNNNSVENHNYTKYNIKIKKMKGEPFKISLKDLCNIPQDNNEEEVYNNLKKNKLLYSKTITVIDPMMKKNKLFQKNSIKKNAPKKIFESKYLDDEGQKIGEFPKKKYYMNYIFDQGSEAIKNNNTRMSSIEEDLTKEYNVIKHIVSTNIDETLKTIDDEL
jgi:hypothetical protein